MPDSLLISLALAAITGLVVLAYKQPKDYAAVFAVIFVPLATLAITLFALKLGMLHGWAGVVLEEASKEVADGSKVSESTITAANGVLDLGRWLLWCVGVAAFLIILRFLPQLLPSLNRDNDPSA